MQQVSDCDWFWGPLKWKSAEEMLLLCEPGTFLLRDSRSDNHVYTISFRTDEKVLHSRVDANALSVGQPLDGSIAAIVEAAIESVRSGALHMNMYRKGMNPENRRLHLKRALRKKDVLPSLQFLAAAVIRKNSLLSEAIRSLPAPLVSFITGPSRYSPDIKLAVSVLASRKAVACS